MDENIREHIKQESKRIMAEGLCESTYLEMNLEAMQLFGDIVGELCSIDPDKKILIYELSELLLQESKLYDFEAAYEAGAQAEGSDSIQSFMDYIKEVTLAPETVELFAKRDKIFYELVALLGETSGLISEFIEAYRNCSSMASKKLDIFFDMGFSAK